MKRILKSWTFWCILLGILVVTYNLTGHDDKNIVMIGLNPLLSTVFNTTAFCIGAEGFSHVWHILSMLSMVIYGLVLDGAKCLLRKNIPCACYILAAMLTAGFFMELVRDHVLYHTTLNSAPFYLWVVIDGVLLLLPAVIALIVGWLLRRRGTAV